MPCMIKRGHLDMCRCFDFESPQVFGNAAIHAIESASLNLKYPFGLSL